MKLGTVEKLLIIGGAGLVVFVIYKMFIAPKADPVVADEKKIDEYISQFKALEKLDPKAIAKLKAAGLDMDKLISTYEQHKKQHNNTSRNNLGKYMSYF